MENIWFNRFLDLAPYIRAYSLRDNANAKLFAQKRNGIHKRLLINLKIFLFKVEEELCRFSKKLEMCSAEKPISKKTQKYFYYSSDQNMLIRKYLFLIKDYNELKESYYKDKIEDLNKTKKDIYNFFIMYTANIIPSHVVATIRDSFFEKDPIGSIYKPKFLYYKNAIIHFSKDVSQIPEPLYITDFDSYLSKFIFRASNILLPDIYYFPNLPEEIDISKYLFAQTTPLSELIDVFIERASQNDFNNFSGVIIPFVLRTFKSFDKTSDKTSTILLIWFRVIINRMYEKYEKTFFKDTQDCIKVWNTSHVKTRELIIKPDMVEKLDQDKEIREVFSNDSKYALAAELLNFIPFIVNPIDILFYFHSALVTVNIAAHSNTMKPSNKLIAFDDLFSLMMGTLWAADVPDFEQVVRISDKLVPKDSTSVVFEYALAGMQALAIHSRKISC